MKNLVTILLLCVAASASAQNCPSIRTIMINSCGSGNSEGANEWLLGRTGNVALNLSNLRLNYGTSSPFSTLTVNGSVAGVWQSKPGSLIIASPGCSNAVLTSGSIPANSNFVLMPSTTDLTLFTASGACFGSGGTVYFLFFNPASTGVDGFNPAGNFANSLSSGQSRTFKLWDASQSSCSLANSTAYTYSGGNWSGGNAEGNAVSFSGATPSYFNAGCNSVLTQTDLRIQLYQSTTNRLTWAFEDTDILAYDLQKSLDGVNYKTVATWLKSLGSNSFEEAKDNQTVYYRLRVQNRSGWIYSNTVFANAAAQVGLTIAPNPVLNSFQAKFNATKAGTAQWTIVDAKGAVLKRQSFNTFVGLNLLQLDMPFASGLYQLRIETADGLFVQKLIKQ